MCILGWADLLLETTIMHIWPRTCKVSVPQAFDKNMAEFEKANAFGEWKECSSLPVAMYDAQVVLLGNKVYVGGGDVYDVVDSTNDISAANVHVYDLLYDDVWETIESPCYWSALVAYKERLVLIGGIEASTDKMSKKLWTLQSEEGAKSSWSSSLPDLTTSRCWASAVTTQHHLIIAGGARGNLIVLDTVEVCNGQQWIEVTSLPIACCRMKSVCYEGNWYLLGGHGQSQNVFYIPLELLINAAYSVKETAAWSVLAGVTPLQHSSPAVYENQLLAIGGEAATTSLSTSAIFAYSPHLTSWVWVGDMPVALSSTCTVVLPTGELLVVGGDTVFLQASPCVFRVNIREKKMKMLEGSVLQREEPVHLVREKLKSQSSKEAHVQVTSTAYLRGVNVIGETSCLVTNEAQTFHWKGYGLKLHVPPASLPPEVRQSSVNIKASLTGQFQFPGNTTLVSAVYWIWTPVMFQQPVTLEIQHCAKSTTRYPLSFAVAKCSQKDLPYQFKPLEGGAFSSFSSYASIALLHFSGLGVTQEVSEQLYCAKQYYIGSKINWRAHFVVTKDLEAYITTVNAVYSGKGCVEGPDQEIEFAEDKITLEIKESGLVTQDGWSIIPLTPLTITRRKVDSYECGCRIPSCQFQIKQSKEQQNAELYHRVKLQGAKEPFDFIVIESDSLPSSAPAADGKTHIYPAASLPDVHSQSKAIAIECKPKPKELLSALYHKVAHRWKHLGIYLELPPATLDAIARDKQQSSQDCLVEMLTTWLQRVDPSPTWSAIVEAVEFLGEMLLARELRTKYCQ